MNRMVWIKWIDSCHQGGWRSQDGYETYTVEDMTCETIGFFMEESEHAIEVIQSKNSGQYDALMAIPKVAILEMRDLVTKRTRPTN